MKLALLKRNKELDELFLVLQPKYYDICIELIEECAGYDKENALYKAPAVASMLETLLKKCSVIWIAECIKNGHEDRQKQTKKFMLLYQADFSTSVNKTVIENQIEANRKRKIILPLKSDIHSLHTYLMENCEAAHEKLQSNFDIKAWRILSEGSLILLQLFNRKRAGEVERIKIEDFLGRESVDRNVHPDLFVQLTEEKPKLTQKYVRMYICGKKKRSVSALLDKTLFKFIKCILKSRSKAGVKRYNSYVFGIKISHALAKSYYRACNLMKKFSGRCGASLPETLRETIFRKHIATFTAMLGVNDNEVSDLANCMEHHKNIHKGVYRVPVSLVDVTGVTQLLQAAMGPTNADEEPSSSQTISAEYDDPQENLIVHERNDASTSIDSQNSSGSSRKRCSKYTEITVNIINRISPEYILS